jgi:hypothetical protein
MINKFVKVLFLIILLLSLKSPICDLQSNVGKKKSMEEMIADGTSGWGGNPDLIQKGRSPLESKKKDYYYHKAIAKASPKAIESGSEVQKQNSCSDAASLIGKYEILEIFMDSLLAEKTLEEEQTQASLFIDEANFLTCKFKESEDKKIKSKNCNGEMQSFGTSECWSIKNKYAECGCLVYFKYNGGKESAFKNLKVK